MLELLRPNKCFCPEILDEDFNEDLTLWVEYLQSLGYSNVTKGDCVIHMESENAFVRIHYGDLVDNEFEFITNDLHGYLACRKFQMKRQGYIRVSLDGKQKVRHFSQSNGVNEYRELPLYGELDEL